MFLTISTTFQPATDLGYLLHKHPDKVQSFPQPFGVAHVFFPVVTSERCTAALLIDIDPVGLVRNRQGQGDKGLLDQYVNDRPYVASSLLSATLSDVFGSALNGRCNTRPELVDQPLPLEITIPSVPSRGGVTFLQELFEPLGYEVTAVPLPLDARFPEWGKSACQQLTLKGTLPLHQALSHLYVLLPVLDNTKHYWVSDAEIEKLVRHGEDWLSAHPLREVILRRYLKHQKSLVKHARDRLGLEASEGRQGERQEDREAVLERHMNLNTQRYGKVVDTLRQLGASSILDIGCGEGRLIRELLPEAFTARVVGMDVSARALESAQRHLNVAEMPQFMRDKLSLLQGSLMYRDARMQGFQAATLVEVIEHLDEDRLETLERVLFEAARPNHVLVTTPNREYNERFASLPTGQLRHPDHRFEWTRGEFQAWASRQAEKYGYQVRFDSIGPEDDALGPPTQMAVFSLALKG